MILLLVQLINCNNYKELIHMSGSGKVLGCSTTACSVALLPNTGGSRTLFWVAMGALGVGLVTLAVTGIVSLKQRSNKA